MNLADIQAVAAQQMQRQKARLERETGHIYYHGQRVGRSVILLRERVAPEDASHDDILTVAAWFHDIGKAFRHHQRFGAALAREALGDLLSPAQLEDVCALISRHDDRRPGSDDSLWLKLLQDADLIDHFGTQWIWLHLFWYAHADESIAEALASENLAAQQNESRAQLHFPESRRIYDEKCAYERAFIERMETESRGEFFEPRETQPAANI
ncbi:MAG: HD domain-containing protein [Oscillospiraceae bacterium]|jgi:uncharacterized protein|nr:HD domain-containing protein [Oscillospiraceae bacterium]